MYDIISSMGHRKRIPYKLYILDLERSISIKALMFIALCSIDNTSKESIEKFFISLAGNLISLIFSTAVNTIISMGIYKLLDKITGYFSRENQRFIWRENYIISILPSVVICISISYGGDLGYFVKGGLSIFAIYYMQEVRGRYSNI